MAKESFILYKSFWDPIKGLAPEEKGQLLDAIFQYNIDGSLPELSPVCQMAFQFMKAQFDRDREKYQKIVERNRKNGTKGGRPVNPDEPTKPTGISDDPTKPKKADTDTEDDTDTANDNGTVSSPDPLKGEKVDKIPFDEFWDLYDKKTGDKTKISKKWNKLSKSIQEEIIDYLPKYKQSQPDKYFRKNPEKFLNNKGWKDEIITPQPKANGFNVGQQYTQTENQRKCNW